MLICNNLKTTELCLILIIMLVGFSCKRTLQNKKTDEAKVVGNLYVDSLTKSGSDNLNDTIKPITIGVHSLEIDTIDLENLLVYIPLEKSKTGYQIEKYAIWNPSCIIPFNTKYFICYINRTHEFIISDTLVEPVLYESESGSTGFTIWKLSGGKFRLICLLDDFIPNYAKVDSVFSLAKGKYLLTGTTGWGDQGDNCGSFWVAVWEFPRSYRMIYSDKWYTPYSESDCDEYSYTYSFSKKEMSIKLNKIKETFDCDNYPAKRLKRVEKDIFIDLNKCLKLDRKINL
jgi:hypothetical protein